MKEISKEITLKIKLALVIMLNVEIYLSKDFLLFEILFIKVEQTWYF